MGEKVGIRRWCAVIIGFLGVLVVVNPQNFQFNYLLVLPILAAIFLTIRDIATKSLATKSNSVEITFVIDKNGKILNSWNKVKVKGHVEEVYNFCKEQ